MGRYRGNITQSILDWYAGRAQAAQQWFTQAVAQYWAFTLQNNASDGTRIWVYDAETLSGAAFPAGTGNPNGNPGAVAGYQGGNSIITPTWQFISSARNAAFNVNAITVTNPSGIVAGNLLLLVLLGSNRPAASLEVTSDPNWLRIGGVDGNANTVGVAVFAKIAGASEPATFGADSSGTNCNFGFHCMQFSGASSPAVGDGLLGQVSAVNGTTLIAPRVVPSVAGDLVYALWAGFDNGQTIVGNSAFTLFSQFQSSSLKWVDGWLINASQNAVGPFNGTMNTSNAWTALTATIKASNVGAAPGQSLSAPIQTVAPLQPGIVSLSFGLQPVGLSGITRWIPPGSHFEWHREAPLAIIDPNTNFNLAGISPELAAWGSLTWLAIK